MRISRAGKLVAGLIVATFAISACGSQDATTAASEGAYQAEVVTWWHGQPETDGLQTLINDFREREPGVEFVNSSVGGDAGGNAKAVIATRLQADDPPDSYQAYAGVELMADVKAGELEDLSYLYDREGWRTKFPRGLLDAVSDQGKLYSVPLSVHRSNVIWYNPKTLASLGISGPPETWEQFLAQTSAIKARGIIPIALGPEWTRKQLLENVLLGTLGVDEYNNLWSGRTDWNSTIVTRALTTYTRIIANSDAKAASGDWQPMLDKIANGGAAYVVTGDWAEGYLGQVRGLEYQKDYVGVPAPGTSGVFNYLSETFTMPVGAPHRAAAEKWLCEVGRLEPQQLFSQNTGGIPARTDADASRYGGYQFTALMDWRSPSTKIVGSLTFGVVASAAWNAELDVALAQFVDDADPFSFAENVTNAYTATRS
jgi:glucose/mannose transport system substrate-binding protein